MAKGGGQCGLRARMHVPLLFVRLHTYMHVCTISSHASGMPSYKCGITVGHSGLPPAQNLANFRWRARAPMGWLSLISGPTCPMPYWLAADWLLAGCWLAAGGWLAGLLRVRP